MLYCDAMVTSQGLTVPSVIERQSVMGTLETGARRGAGWVWQGSGADPTDTGPADRTRIRWAWIDKCALSVLARVHGSGDRTGVVRAWIRVGRAVKWKLIVESRWRCEAMRCGNEDGGCKKGGGKVVDRLLPEGRQECDYSR